MVKGDFRGKLDKSFLKTILNVIYLKLLKLIHLHEIMCFYSNMAKTMYAELYISPAGYAFHDWFSGVSPPV